jgi:hypothetical protein
MKRYFIIILSWSAASVKNNREVTNGWEFTDRFSVIDFMKKMVYPTNNNKSKLGG